VTASTRRYYRGYDLVGMHEVATNTLRYYQFDHQGTTQCLTGPSGTVTDRFASDAWGAPVERTGSTINRNWYIGRWGYYRQVDRILDYVKARYFEPVRAAWLSRDPLADAVAPYRYVRNQPSRRLDPSGLQSCGPRPTDCCDNYDLRHINADPGLQAKCSGGTWGKCQSFDAVGRRNLLQQCLDGFTDCFLMERAIYNDATACAYSCEGNTPQQTVRNFQAAAYSPCCVNKTTQGQLTTYRCKSCGTYCCDVNMSTNPCDVLCTYEHESSHVSQCNSNKCTQTSSQEEKQECLAYWVSVNCLFVLYTMLGCPPISAQTRARIGRCDQGQNRK